MIEAETEKKIRPGLKRVALGRSDSVKAILRKIDNINEDQVT